MVTLLSKENESITEEINRQVLDKELYHNDK